MVLFLESRIHVTYACVDYVYLRFINRFNQSVRVLFEYDLDTKQPTFASTVKDPLRHNALCCGMNDPRVQLLIERKSSEKSGYVRIRES